MTTDSTTLPSDHPPAGETALAGMEWRYTPSDLSKKRGIVFGFAMAAGLGGLFLFQHWALGMLGFLGILFSTFEVLSPPSFRLDSQGVRSRVGWSVTEIPWDRVKRVMHDQRGVLVSPLAESSRLDAFRGVYLRFSGNQEAVLAKLRQLWSGEIQETEIIFR